LRASESFSFSACLFLDPFGISASPESKMLSKGCEAEKNETSMIRKVDIWILSVGAGVSGKMKYFRLRLKRKFDTCGYGEGYGGKGDEADFLVLR
jgi:hypothetical protein